jgi:hypothetical protein
MKMKKALLLMIVLFTFTFVYSQQQEQNSGGQKGQVLVKNNKELSEHERYEKLLSEMDGTFQIRSIDESKKPLLSENLLIRIRDARLYNQSVIMDVESGISVFIPSQVEISSATFVKLDKVVYQ